MKSAEIKEILNGKFNNPEDRIYWEKKLAEAIRKEKNAKENDAYFAEFIKFDR